MLWSVLAALCTIAHTTPMVAARCEVGATLTAAGDAEFGPFAAAAVLPSGGEPVYLDLRLARVAAHTENGGFPRARAPDLMHTCPIIVDVLVSPRAREWVYHLTLRARAGDADYSGVYYLDIFGREYETELTVIVC